MAKEGGYVLKNVEVGPIWNDEDATKKAETYLREHPTHGWTGQWWTTEPGKMSVLQVYVPNDLEIRPLIVKAVEVGPIWNQQDAYVKGRKYLSEHPGQAWTGQWWTTVEGEMSVLQILMPVEK